MWERLTARYIPLLRLPRLLGVLMELLPPFAIATQAAAVTTLFNATSPAQMPCTAFCAQGGELGALTLTPGIYESAPGTFAITNGDLTLDAQGDAMLFWVFRWEPHLRWALRLHLGA